ncbi:hypothetical protein J4450_02330 [Candidatus Micrarchaeota archaeon]|nr:hypothetical protein [Candidatus Micrarchaeota archaeon]
MLIEYLEQSAADLRALEQRLLGMANQYRMFMDRDIREQMEELKKEIRKNQAKILSKVYAHMQEFVLLKRHFPGFFQVLKEDQYLSRVINRIEWLFEFKKLDAATCQVELLKIKEQRKQLREAKEFLKKWVGKVDKKSMEATWPILKDQIADKMDRDEVRGIIKNKNKELRRKGWLLIINEPFIISVLNRLFEKLKKIREQEAEIKLEIERLKGKNIYARSDAEKKLKLVTKERKKMERKCEHVLLANYEYLLKIKKQRPTWRDKTANMFMQNLIEKININPINEKLWIEELNKKLNS